MQEDNCVFELTYNWGKEDGYSKGDAYAQVRPPACATPLHSAHVACALSCSRTLHPAPTCIANHLRGATHLAQIERRCPRSHGQLNNVACGA